MHLDKYELRTVEQLQVFEFGSDIFNNKVLFPEKPRKASEIFNQFHISP
ncbi:MAG: hypothetical protein ACOCUQ_03050 [Bacteroidota bacterium]